MKEKISLREIKKILGIVMGIAVALLLVRFVINSKDIFTRLQTISLEDIIICLLITVGAILCSSIMDRYLAEILGVKIGYKDCFETFFVAAAINIVMPMGAGSVVRAEYLKQKCKLSYSKFVSVSAGIVVLQVIIILLEAVISLLLGAIFYKSDVKIVLAAGGLLAGVLGGIYLSKKYQKWFLKWLPFKTYTEPIFKSFFELFDSKKIMVKCTILYIINTILVAIRFYFIFKTLDSQISILNAILYQSVYNASGLICILPGNIGIGEMLIGITNSFLGSNFDAGVAATLINRVIYYIVCIGGGILFALPLYRRYTDNYSE